MKRLAEFGIFFSLRIVRDIERNYHFNITTFLL